MPDEIEERMYLLGKVNDKFATTLRLKKCNVFSENGLL